MNKVILIGRLTRDPELRYTSSNIATASFSLAVDRNFTNQNGEREADFINIVVWRKQAENCKNYLTKGSQVAIDGRIQTRSYDGQDGQKRYVTEVVADNVQFLGTRANNNMDTNSQPAFNDNATPYDFASTKAPAQNTQPARPRAVGLYDERGLRYVPAAFGGGRARGARREEGEPHGLLGGPDRFGQPAGELHSLSRAAHGYLPPHRGGAHARGIAGPARRAA